MPHVGKTRPRLSQYSIQPPQGDLQRGPNSRGHAHQGRGCGERPDRASQGNQPSGLGLAQLIEGLASILFGIEPQGNFPAPFPRTESFKIPFALAFNETIFVQKTLVAAFVVAMLGAISFALFFKFTRAGLAMRATAEDHELARSVGIDVSRAFGLSWAIAGVIATAGGVLLAMLTGVSLSISMVVMVAFPALLLGGLESLPGAILGGIAVGLAQELVEASKLIEIRNSTEIAPYVLLLIVLLIRPEGLFGQKRIERI